MNGKRKKNSYAIARPFADFGRYLAEKRAEKGFTQRQVSQRLKYSSAQFISNFERGIALPPLKNIKILIALYGLNAAEVVDQYMAVEKARVEEALK